MFSKIKWINSSSHFAVNLLCDFRQVILVESVFPSVKWDDLWDNVYEQIYEL